MGAELMLFRSRLPRWKTRDRSAGRSKRQLLTRKRSQVVLAIEPWVQNIEDCRLEVEDFSMQTPDRFLLFTLPMARPPKSHRFLWDAGGSHGCANSGYTSAVLLRRRLLRNGCRLRRRWKSRGRRHRLNHAFPHLITTRKDKVDH